MVSTFVTFMPGGRQRSFLIQIRNLGLKKEELELVC